MATTSAAPTDFAAPPREGAAPGAGAAVAVSGAAAPTGIARLSSPRLYLARMAVFLTLSGFLAFILHEQIRTFFLANPGLNGLIFGVLFVGVVLAVRLILHLNREVIWANAVRGAGTRGRVRAPVLLQPLAALIDRTADIAFPLSTTRALLDSVQVRLDENREVLRYLAGLLVFLGLVGTFWGLIETVGSVGKLIQAMRAGNEASAMFDELKTALAAPLSGMAVSFSSSLFGLTGSLILGFLDLQVSRAQNRFFTELENVLAHSTTIEPGQVAPEAALAPEIAEALNRLSAAIEGGGARQQTLAMANLAEGIQGLVQHMRAEQQLIRDWVEAQASRERELKGVLERLARARVG